MDDQRFAIFEQIDTAGIWLMFQPLRKLYGFYQRIGDVAGIVINSGHPTTLQRYTAAHEYGHHVLGHTASLDSHEEIAGTPPDNDNVLQEIAAQAFAGALLMPLHLVHRVARELEVDLHRCEPRDVYSLSLRFGVSYLAMRTQLRTYKLVTPEEYVQLDLQPLRIKELIGGGQPPDDHRAELWLLDRLGVTDSLPLQVADEVIVRVDENRSTGYRWRLADDPDNALVLIGDQTIDDNDGEVLGATRTRLLRFRASQPGSAHVHVGLSRASTPEDEVETVDAVISIAAPNTGTADHGLFVDVQHRIARSE